jgi:RNA polymerase sigma-70 factor (ECF subfamily)
VRLSESKTVAKRDFRALVDDYSAQVLNVAMRILGDIQKAQDVHQEVFLAIWQRWHKYNSQVNWRAYLYRATVRKAIRLAKQSRNKALAEQQAAHNSNENGPDESLRIAELQQKLGRCLAKLPKRQADAFVLSRMEGLKAEKIAELLGCSQETVRVHLHRAVRRLARELGDYLTE